MDAEVHVLDDGTRWIREYAQAANKTYQAAFAQTARGAVRHVISITPPASAFGVSGGLDTGRQAKARGTAAIWRDLNHAFASVKLKHQRRERISGAEMVAIHRRLLAQKRPGAKLRRDRGQPYFVDARKVQQYAGKLISSVGKLASGWMAAADALKVRAAAWISRHGTRRGSVHLDVTGPEFYLFAYNNPSPHAPAWVGPEMQRRATSAARYAINDLERQLPYLNGQAAKSAGLATG